MKVWKWIKKYESYYNILECIVRYRNNNKQMQKKLMKSHPLFWISVLSLTILFAVLISVFFFLSSFYPGMDKAIIAVKCLAMIRVRCFLSHTLQLHSFISVKIMALLNRIICIMENHIIHHLVWILHTEHIKYTRQRWL